MMLPSTIATVAAFLPPIAALRAHRSFVRDPAGQVAACWLVMALVGLTEAVLFFRGVRIPAYISMGVTGAFPALLLSPLLTWLGPSWRRWRWPALAAWLVLWLAATRVWPEVRPFRAIFDSGMSVAMCALSAATLAARVRWESAAPARADWLWILTGLVMYFAMNIVRMPLLEALVAGHWDALVPVNNGFELVHVVVYLVIARGMLLPAASASARYVGPVGKAA